MLASDDSRSPVSRSSLTAVVRPSAAAWDNRVYSAVTRLIVTIECGSMNSRKAVCWARVPPNPSGTALSTFVLTIRPNCWTMTAANAQIAMVEAVRSPTPRKWKLGRKVYPARRSGMISTSAWATMPSVALPARTAIIFQVHRSGSATSSGCVPNQNQTRPAIATTFASTGDHMNAPNRPRALRFSPSSV